jgi:hypothetical protein
MKPKMSRKSPENGYREQPYYIKSLSFECRYFINVDLVNKNHSFYIDHRRHSTTLTSYR